MHECVSCGQMCDCKELSDSSDVPYIVESPKYFVSIEIDESRVKRNSKTGSRKVRVNLTTRDIEGLLLDALQKTMSLRKSNAVRRAAQPRHDCDRHAWVKIRGYECRTCGVKTTFEEGDDQR